ncbi:MAG: efflux RND transporter periplasmic adaptor subunit [Planctomycetota bacterium]
MTQRASTPPSALLALLGAALVAGCAEQSSEGKETAVRSGARRTEAPRVIAAEVERDEMVRYLETTTKIESEREIMILPETAGIVLRVLAEEGDVVDRDDVLCVLDSRDQELAKRDAEVALQEAQDAAQQPELDRAEADARVTSTLRSWEQAQRDHERDLRLFADDTVASPVSQQAIEASRLAMDTAQSDHEQAKIALQKVELAEQQAKTAVARAEVALARTEFALSQCTVTAPFPGMIAERSVRIGQSVGPADSIYVLTDTENIRAVFYRAQEELDLFRPRAATREGGEEAPVVLTFEATTEAIPGEVFAGRVLRVSPTIDRDSGQFRVTGVFERSGDPSVELLPGMLVRLRIATDRHPDALVLPKRAVRREGELPYVLRIDDDRTIERIAVREGYEDDERVEIEPVNGAGLAAGDLVVAVGSRDLENGDPVRVEGEEDGTEPVSTASAATEG